MAARCYIPRVSDEAALNVAVFRMPGPEHDRIEQEAKRLIDVQSPAPEGWFGYLTLHASDFDRLWDGVSAGDSIGAAFDVLPHLGPEAAAFVGRIEDFIFGWVGHEDATWGRVLLLQVIPRPHMFRRRERESN